MLFSRRTTLATAAVVGTSALVGCAKVDPTGQAPVTSAGGGETSAAPATSDASATGNESSAAPTSESPSAAPRPKLEVTSAHPLTALHPADVLNLAVTDGTLGRVTVTNAEGEPVPGSLEGTTWKPERSWRPSSSYRASVVVTAADGTENTVPVKLTTVKGTTTGVELLYAGFTVGVAMPVILKFSAPVASRDQRAAIEKQVKVEVTPAQPGAWGWLDDQQLAWRPARFFTAGSRISVSGNLDGLQTGSSSWLRGTIEGKLAIGDARVSTVDIAAHQMTVTRNGRVVRKIPVTCGKQGFITRSGTKVIIERHKDIVMDSNTVDIPANSPDAYRLKVFWAMRLTYTGEFIHAAPWSVKSQGRTNVSHGCTGMSMADAQWLFNFSRAGDPVVYRGSQRQLKPHETIGVWCYSYPEWRQQSAL